MREPALLDVAHRHRLTQRGERIAGGDELVRYEPREGGVGDGRCDRAPVQLLGAVQLVAAGHAPGVEVRDPLPVVTDGADDVAFHDLHVIDVVQQPDARRAHGLHHRDSEGRPVALVVRVIDLAVQELEADRDPLFFRLRLDRVEPRDTVVDRLPVAPAATVAEHRDHIRDGVARGERNGLLQLVQQHPVVRAIVEARRNEVAARGGIAHGAYQALLTYRVPVVGTQQVDRDEPHSGGRASELPEGDLSIRPTGDGLLEPSQAEARARRNTALKGRTHGGGSQRRHCRSPVHQNSRRFKYSQLARIDANASAGWSCSTKKCLIPACCSLAKIRFQSILPAPTSAILLSGGPIESFTWTIGNRPGQRAKYARGSCPPLVIQYRSISSWTSLGSVSASRMSYGSLPSTGVNSKSWL